MIAPALDWSTGTQTVHHVRIIDANIAAYPSAGDVWDRRSAWTAVCVQCRVPGVEYPWAKLPALCDHAPAAGAEPLRAADQLWCWSLCWRVLRFAWQSSIIPFALRATIPMVVLLVPALGLWISDPFYRDRCLHILVLGAARWMFNLLIFQAFDRDLWLAMGLAMGLGVGLLWLSIWWGRQQLREPLAAPVYPAVTLPAAAPAPPALPATPAPIDLARSVRCPICREPTALALEDCLSCGLVFRSRVPAALLARQDYAVLRPLGDGGMSSVYLARRAADSQLCVLKTLDSVDARDTLAWREDAAECLRREAALLAQIDHPHVAHLLNRAGDHPSDFLVLEYIAGPTARTAPLRGGRAARPQPKCWPMAAAWPRCFAT